MTRVLEIEGGVGGLLPDTAADTKKEILHSDVVLLTQGNQTRIVKNRHGGIGSLLGDVFMVDEQQEGEG
jgi:hypothetical protein